MEGNRYSEQVDDKFTGTVPIEFYGSAKELLAESAELLPKILAAVFKEDRRSSVPA